MPVLPLESLAPPLSSRFIIVLDARRHGGPTLGAAIAGTAEGTRNGCADDISVFLKDIDAARPLLGRYRQQQREETPDPEPTQTAAPQPHARATGGLCTGAPPQAHDLYILCPST
ncbi:hypothetical protein B0H19DRAFT_316498 [Mycena capillaripes]|nr:hypothetical protein B0H19DRAFT_316498 [Mycena capillaripes]